MTYSEDTIAAISTPIGQGGIGIVRLSGPEAIRIAGSVFRPSSASKNLEAAPGYSAHYGELIDPANGMLLDEVILTIMRRPRSYTREDVVEISSHGGMTVSKRILETVLASGARMAEPGEFTKRAFLNGRISLPQAEAVMDLISARTDESRRIAVDQLRGRLARTLEALRQGMIDTCALVEAYIDFPEDEIGETDYGAVSGRIRSIVAELDKLLKSYDEARFFREGLSVAIVGRPNVGKSSLLNALLNQNRAIVTEVPGTTRDIIEECMNIKGLPVRIIDTAGIRHSSELVEREGINRSLEKLDTADFVLAVFDGSMPLDKQDLDIIEKAAHKKKAVVINKADLPLQFDVSAMDRDSSPVVRISTHSGEGLDELKDVIYSSNLAGWAEEREGVVVTNLRQKEALGSTVAALRRATAVLEAKQPLEIAALELREALEGIGRITGVVTDDTILDRIFSEFCIGK